MAGGRKGATAKRGTMGSPAFNKALAQNVAAEKVQMYGQVRSVRPSAKVQVQCMRLAERRCIVWCGQPPSPLGRGCPSHLPVSAQPTPAPPPPLPALAGL